MFWNNRKPTTSVTVAIEEAVKLVSNITEKEYCFHIGKGSDGTWYAMTDQHASPKFCLASTDRDDAYSKGLEAMTFYWENVEAKQQ